MDVHLWSVGLFPDSGNYDQQPGLRLTVQLKCRICGEIHQACYAHSLTPLEVKEGEAYHTYSQPASWFKFAVEARLALRRECLECGTLSVMPLPQRQPLIDEADCAVDITWLRTAVQRMNFEVVRIPDSETRYAHDEYRVAACPPIEFAWRGLEVPVN